jgi:hypothetical protein
MNIIGSTSAGNILVEMSDAEIEGMHRIPHLKGALRRLGVNVL